MTTLDEYVGRIIDLAEVLGPEHVSLGTDMDANYKPVFDTYANLPHYVVGLTRRGLREDEVAKLVGGNFLRILAAVQGQT